VKSNLNLAGVTAALLTPRRPDLSLDLDAFAANIEMVLDDGATGVCLNGATAEYCTSTVAERQAIVQRAADVVRRRAALVVSIGAADLAACLSLASHAESAGADAVLLPPPHFFPYTQDDIEQFYRVAAAEIRLPLLIYNLPSFTSPVETATAVRLVESVSNIAGIKDSSGSVDTLLALSQADIGACRLVGNDSAIGKALELLACDGSISGIAGVLPKLSVSVFESASRGDLVRLRLLLAKLDELISRLVEFPIPWALKLIAQSRGMFPAAFPLPLSPARQALASQFQDWFKSWWAGTAAGLESAAVNPH